MHCELSYNQDVPTWSFTRQWSRRAPPARHASPPNPPSEVDDEDDIEEVVRIQPPPEDLEQQDFKPIKIDRQALKTMNFGLNSSI